jgi:hypothetical protein
MVFLDGNGLKKSYEIIPLFREIANPRSGAMHFESALHLAAPPSRIT